MLTEVRRLRPKAAKPRRLAGGSRARDCFEVVISCERAWRTDHAIVRLPAPIFGRSTLQPYRLARHDVATLEMRSSSRETRLRTPIARLWSFRPQYAVAPYVLNASPLASRCDIREEPMSMLIGTRIAKQRDARELFVFDEKLGDFVLRGPANRLQPRRSVEMYNGRDFVPPLCSCLVIEKHVRVRRSGIKNIWRTIL